MRKSDTYTNNKFFFLFKKVHFSLLKFNYMIFCTLHYLGTYMFLNIFYKRFYINWIIIYILVSILSWIVLILTKALIASIKTYKMHNNLFLYSREYLTKVTQEDESRLFPKNQKDKDANGRERLPQMVHSCNLHKWQNCTIWE